MKFGTLQKKFAYIVLLTAALTANCTRAYGAGDAEHDCTSFVRPFIGTGGHGHTYPGATVPFGMVQLSPDTGIQDWDWCSGYHESDNVIFGFSHTHLSGTGCGDLGDILFAPTTGTVDLVSRRPLLTTRGPMQKARPPYASGFSHKNETASPGYYSVKLDRDGGIFVELTATERAGLHRYTFPSSSASSASQKANIIIDLTHGISDQPIELALNIVGDHKITGLRRSKGWAQDQYVYFTAEFSQPFTNFGTAVDNQAAQEQSREAKGKKVRGFLTFDASGGKPIIAKVALSTTSIEGAERNLAAEVPGFDFDRVRDAAAEKWRSSLSTIRVKASQPAEQRDREVFYTALYHAMLAPTIISDVDGAYRGSDHELHSEKKCASFSTFSLWDTFRAEHPLLTIVRPDLVNALITSIVHQGQYHKDKTLAIWPLYACETYCMIGYHSFPVIAEAYRKGFRDFDAKAALEMMLANSTRNDWWANKGYIPADKEDQSVSKTLEFAYDDWALAQFAKALGNGEAGKKFQGRAQEYKNVFDSKQGFARGRLADGSWRTPFDPANSKPSAQHDFTEGSAWQYTFFVPQDVPGLISELGGKAAFIQKLDDLFDRATINEKESVIDVSGAIGQYAQGNEPSHHIAYLYNYAGAPAKTQKRVRQIRELYGNGTDGLCGNEDCGQMSAWYVLSALGFYPVNPVSGEYVLGVPSFPKAEINLGKGKVFTILCNPPGKYVEKVFLNGRPLSRTYITHEEITGGGTLHFLMTNKEGSKWGTGEHDAPH